MLYAAQCDMHGEHYSTVPSIVQERSKFYILYIQVQIFDADLPGWLLLHLLYHCHISVVIWQYGSNVRRRASRRY